MKTILEETKEAIERIRVDVKQNADLLTWKYDVEAIEIYVENAEKIIKAQGQLIDKLSQHILYILYGNAPMLNFGEADILKNIIDEARKKIYGEQNLISKDIKSRV